MTTVESKTKTSGRQIAHDHRRRIFVGGCQRSGTTMTGHLLADATGLLLLPECQILREAIKLANVQISDSTVQRMHFLDHWRINLWGEDFAQRRGELNRNSRPEVLFESMCRLYGETSDASDRYDRGWVENSPHNFQWFSDLRTKFQNARFLHVIRDPRAVAASYLNVDFGPTSAVAAALSWKASVMDGILAETYAPDIVCRVRYEDVVERPKQALCTVAEKLGLEFDATWQPVGRQADPNLESHQTLITQGPVKHRTDAWKEELNDKQIADIEYIAGSAMQMLGYELTPGAARTSSITRRYCSQAIDGVKQLLWQLPKRHIARRLRGVRNLQKPTDD